MKVNQNVLNVLAAAEIDGNNVVLVGTLDRALYAQVAKVLKAAGGTWNRRAQATVFDDPAEPILEAIMLTGEVTDARKEFDAFYTPADLAAEVVEQAFVHLEMGAPLRVLEPSAGDGALVREVLRHPAEVTAFDIRTEPWAVEPPAGCTFVEQDFLTVESTGDFDIVVMNPPFSRQQDMRHVIHALDFLRSGGRLVAIMSPAWTFRSTAVAKDLRRRTDEAASYSWRDLPDGSFKPSGTSVNTGVLEVVAL